MPFKGGVVMEIASIQKYKKYTVQERTELLDAYKRSGVPKKEWCEEHGIAVGTLHKWLNRDKKQAGTKMTQSWAPVTVLPQTKDTTLLLQAGKFSIEVGKSTDMELLSAVLSVLVPLC
jgi:transposase-like protein